MRRTPVLLALIIAATTTVPAFAGGYYSGNKGARPSGRAGAFVARADDVMAAHWNPAGLARIEGTLVQIGNQFSYNAYSYRREPTLDWGNVENGVPPYVEFETVENDVPWQLLDPLLGVSSNLGLRDFGFALVAYAPPGVSREQFPVDGGNKYMMVSREALIVNYTASVAWKYQDVFGVGLSAQWIAVPSLKYQLVVDANQFPADVNPVESELDMLATVSGSDLFTPNAIIGAWFKAAPFLEFGVSGQVIPTSIETESTLEIAPQSSEIDEDVVLRRDGDPADDVSLTLPLPLNARVGARYVQRVGDRELFDVELNVLYETWSRVEHFLLETNGLAANLLGQTLEIGTIQVEKQWRDTITVQLGGDYAVAPDLLGLRGGVYYETAVAEDAYAHVDFPSGQQLGAALGGSVFFDDFELALAYEYRHQPDLAVSEADARVYQEVPGSQCAPPYDDPNICNEQYLGQPAPAVNAGVYRAHSHIAAVDLLYRF